MKLIPLKGSNTVAVVDDASYEAVRPYEWYVNEQGYPEALVEFPGRLEPVSMHVLITVMVNQRNASLTH